MAAGQEGWPTTTPLILARLHKNSNNEKLAIWDQHAPQPIAAEPECFVSTSLLQISPPRLIFRMERIAVIF